MIARNAYWSQAQAAAAWLEQRGLWPVEVVIQCGSGLMRLGDELLPHGTACELAEIPHFPAVGVPGHGRQARQGLIDGRGVLVLSGRTHLYEGLGALACGFPAALASAAGARLFVALNAAGGLDPALAPGSIVVHRDFINLMHDSPLLQLHTDDPAERFIDPKPAFDPACSARLAHALAATGLGVSLGIYAGVPGPAYETAAEMALLRQWGADVVGMSCIPEYLVCHFLRLPVVGASVVANSCRDAAPLGHAAVVAASAQAAPALAAGLRSLLAELPEGSVL
jgi:purine-nucleoside phosphorylase